MRIKEFFFLNIKQKRELIEYYINSKNFKYKTESFKKNGYDGFNYLVLDWYKEDKPNIVITAHYDGVGAYDNIGGVVGLFWLIKWAALDKLESINDNFGFIPVFTDGEEHNLLGARQLIKSNIFKEIRIHAHLSLDGFGIGNHIGGFGNVRKLNLELKNNKKTELIFSADTTIFQDNRIPSIHVFTLPLDQLNNLVKKSIFPSCWRIVHTKSDTPDKTDDETLPFVVYNLYRKFSYLNFFRKGVFIVL